MALPFELLLFLTENLSLNERGCNRQRVGIRGDSHAVCPRIGRSGRCPAHHARRVKQAIKAGFLEQKDSERCSIAASWLERTYEGNSYRAPRDRAHLGMYYATVSRHLKQRANRKCVIARPTQNPVLQPEKPLLISLVIRSNRKSPHSSDSCGGLPVPW